MITKTITYRNYNGVMVTEDFHFHLSEAELLEKQLTTDGGYEKKLAKIIKAKKDTTAIKEFKSLILASYGEKTDDGKHFYKSPTILKDFLSTEAYSKLYVELITDPKAAAEFFDGIMPESIKESITNEEIQKKTEELLGEEALKLV